MRNRVKGLVLLCFLSLVFYSCQNENTVPPAGLAESKMDPATINLNVTVKFLVGKFIYENNEATIVCKGFDVSNNEKWSDEFYFTGPQANALPIAAGFDHYTISLEKWGVTDSQDLTAQQLLDNRADGPHPVTYGLGGKVPVVKKPAVVYTSFETSGVGVTYSSKTQYKYSDDGKVEMITFFDTYSENGPSQVPSRYQVFTYGDNGNLSKITTYDGQLQTKIVEDTYIRGFDEFQLRISETNKNAAVSSTVDLSTDPSSLQSKAAYRYSNGRSFDYNFTTSWKNLVSDEETIGTELCNHGNYTYDRNINPFKHLNYISYLVSDNWSINNMLTEDVEFLACAFPSLRPLSHEYKYDEMGYPTEKITHYTTATEVSTTRYEYRIFPQ